MSKFNWVSLAILTTVCSNSFAQDGALPDTQAPATDESGSPLVFRLSAYGTTNALEAPAPSASETRSRTLQKWLDQVKNPYANQLGTGNGAGVTVGVVDTGAQVTHPSLRGQVSASFNAFTGGQDVTDEIGHGTHVAGLIAGTSNFGGLTEGVAPGAKLAVAKVFKTGGSNSVTIAKGIDWVVNVQRAPILSLSLGVAAPVLQPSIQNAVDKGVLVVAAMGNNGSTKSASWPAAFAKKAWARGQIIAVGAVDANNVRASFSNYDPTLANWTVYAPGVGVVSAYSTPTEQNAYAAWSGTSMATPIVSGQGALLKSNWMFLTAADTAKIIFQTATRLCSDAVAPVVCADRKTADAVYGWGVVNIGASLQPVGSLTLGSPTGDPITLNGSLLSSAKTGLASSLKGVDTLAVDSFRRAFTVKLTTLTAPAPVTTRGTPAVPATVVSAKGVKFTVEASAAVSNNPVFGLSDSQGALTVVKTSLSSSDNGISYGFGTGGTSGTFFGLDATSKSPLSLSGEIGRFTTPYFGLSDNASHVGYGFTFGDGVIFRAGAVTHASPGAHAAPLIGGHVTSARNSVATLELQKSFGESVGIVTVGQLRESGSLLGLTGSGVFALGGSANTRFVTLSGNRPIYGNTSVSAMASFGRTAAYTNTSASLIEGTTGASSAAWSLGLAQKDFFRAGDSLGLTVAMPLRAKSGSMQVTTAVAQSQEDGSLTYATQSISLKPSGRQRDLELAYATPVSFGGNVTAIAQAKFQPGHDAAAPAKFGIGFRYSRKF